MDALKPLSIAAAGMQAQSKRMKVIAENIANAQSTADVPGAEPYRRKVVSFANTLDREMDVHKVRVKRVTEDMSEFGKRYDPGHPAASKDGYVQLPNVNGLVEVMDLREARRSYEANLNVIEAARGMMSRTLDLLRR